jgi:hypothetical protein
VPGLNLLVVEVHDISYILKILINIYMLNEITIFVFHFGSSIKILKCPFTVQEVYVIVQL